MLLATFSADKGGTGKSTIALVLAHLYRRTNVPVLLIDCSYDSPYLSTVLQLLYNIPVREDSKGLVNWLQGVALPEEVVYSIDDMFCYIPPGVGNIEVEEVEDVLHSFFTRLRKFSDIVTILDMPAMLSNIVLEGLYPAVLLHYVDVLMVVSDYDIVSIRHLLHYATNIIPRYYPEIRQQVLIVNKCLGALPEDIVEKIHQLQKRVNIELLSLKYVDAGPYPAACAIIRDITRAFTDEEEYNSFRRFFLDLYEKYRT